MRELIVQEIRRLALERGQAPGQRLFAKETGISEHQWRGRFWARWGDALAEAGFSPNDWNSKLDSNQILACISAEMLKIGRFPTRDELSILRTSNPNIPSDNVIRRHFGRRPEFVAALGKFSKENSEFTDILKFLPNIENKPTQPKLNKSIDGFVYLIKSGDFYKIGRSDDVERRIKQISVALPQKMQLFHTIRTDDPAGIEHYWHRRFSDRRANGEWFKLTQQDVAAFKRRSFQ